jgi:hypothetical protein
MAQQALEDGNHFGTVGFRGGSVFDTFIFAFFPFANFGGVFFKESSVISVGLTLSSCEGPVTRQRTSIAAMMMTKHK